MYVSKLKESLIDEDLFLVLVQLAHIIKGYFYGHDDALLDFLFEGEENKKKLFPFLHSVVVWRRENSSSF